MANALRDKSVVLKTQVQPLDDQIKGSTDSTINLSVESEDDAVALLGISIFDFSAQVANDQMLPFALLRTARDDGLDFLRILGDEQRTLLLNGEQHAQQAREAEAQSLSGPDNTTILASIPIRGVPPSQPSPPDQDDHNGSQLTSVSDTQPPDLDAEKASKLLDRHPTSRKKPRRML